MNSVSAQPTATHDVPPTALRGSKRILVADSDPGLCRMIVFLFEQAGHRDETAADGELAWAALLADDYDLLVTGRNMPKVSGLALVRRVRVAQMALPTILISGTPAAAELSRDPWQRVDAFVRKPFTISELLAAVHRLLPAAAPFPAATEISREPDQRVFGRTG